MILKLKPVCLDKVWGGSKLKDIYSYDCSNKTGEAWGISAHQQVSSTIISEPYQGMTLRQLYLQERQLFGHYPKPEFPILIKVIDAMDDLSIQVHPDDDYAKEHENAYGKTECWYILDADPNTDIIIGHKAKDRASFIKAMETQQLETILNKFPVKKGDLFNIYAGTVHAICKGTLLLEIQQSSDVTYRLYDYNRLDKGKLRDLHIDQALDVIRFPDNALAKHKPTHLFDFEIVEPMQSTTRQADIYGDYIFILEGEGFFDDVKVNKGDFIFATSKTQYEVKGHIKFFRGIIK